MMVWKAIQALGRWGLGCALLWQICGCVSTSHQLAEPDSALEEHFEDGQEAYNEGFLRDADKEYRLAILRAWSMDSPYDSGTAAYNFAACLVSEDKCDQANRWLIDARVDLCRARVSTGNTWLLAAKIASAQGLFDQARAAINCAARAGSDCEFDEEKRLCGPAVDHIEENCQPSCISKLPWIGKKVEKKKTVEACQREYQVSIQLSLARLAAAEQDVDTARKHLERACECADGLCSLAIEAERHDVAAMVCDLEGKYVQAGGHRDCESDLLRAMGEYREIPKVLRAAADSYCMAEKMDLAVDRLIRCARIYLARADYEKSWCHLRLAGDLLGAEACTSNRVRLELTAEFLEEKLLSVRPQKPVDAPPALDAKPGIQPATTMP